jgi:hypothetical protein
MLGVQDMIRLSLLRLTLTVAKTATAISDSLRPRTWKLIAIASALAGISFLLMYQSLELTKPGLDIAPIQVAAVEPVPLPAQITVAIDPLDSSSRQLDIWVLTSASGTGWAVRQSVGEEFVAPVGIELSAISAHMGSHREALLTASPAANWLGWERNLPSIGANEQRVVVSESLSSGAWTGLKLLVKLVPLFQGVATILNSFLAMILSLIAYNRSKVDLKLKALDLQIKQLQLLQLQRQLEREAREWQKKIEAETKSNIILVN